jgi:hypothetical protein
LSIAIYAIRVYLIPWCRRREDHNSEYSEYEVEYEERQERMGSL